MGFLKNGQIYKPHCYVIKLGYKGITGDLFFAFNFRITVSPHLTSYRRVLETAPLSETGNSQLDHRLIDMNKLSS